MSGNTYDDSGKYPFLGHYAVLGSFFDGVSDIITFLADLGHHRDDLITNV